MKRLLTTTLMLACLLEANPYIEYKHEHSQKDWEFDKNVQHIRLGYQFENKTYIEAGKMTDGYSWEAGYKLKLSDNLKLKGKIETKDAGVAKSKIQTEIRYTF